MERVETRIWNRANAGQTSGQPNTINNAAHRFVGSGTGNTIHPNDFAKARYALTKAKVPLNNLVAIVDPSVTYTFQTQANLVNLISPMQQSESILREGMTTGLRFRFNVMGFDVYESNYLPRDITESISGGGSVSSTGVANFFFSATPGDTMPIVGGFRQMPKVDSEWNKDLQQWEFVTMCEFGFKLYRPENLVTVLTDYNVV